MHDKSGIREGHFKPGFVMALYLQTIEHGISKTALKLSDTDKPLPERVKLLLGGMKKLNEGDWKDLYLITPSWIDHATRIKRHATSGKDNLLMRHIQNFISDDKEVVKRLKTPQPNEDEWKGILDSAIKAIFLRRRQV